MAQKDIADRTDCATLCRRGAFPELRRGGSRRATPRRRGAVPELRALPNRAAAAKFQNCAAAAERADSPARPLAPPTHPHAIFKYAWRASRTSCQAYSRMTWGLAPPTHPPTPNTIFKYAWRASRKSLKPLKTKQSRRTRTSAVLRFQWF